MHMSTPRYTFFNHTYIVFSLCMCLLSQNTNAIENTQVAMKDLGDFNVSWKAAAHAEYLSGQVRLGVVNHVPGENYVLKLPFAVQQIQYEVANGEFVNKGDLVATISGIEVEHFIDVAESAEAIYQATRANYKANETNYRERVIQNPGWLALAKNYHQAKLEFAHNQHILGLLSFDDSSAVRLKAPITGYVQINPSYMDAVEQPLLEILPEASFYVEVNLPANGTGPLSHFTVKNKECRLTPTIREPMMNAHYQRVWSSFNREKCSLKPGQTISVIPSYSFSGFKVSHSAVFRLEDRLYVAAKHAEALTVHEVTIHESDHQFHYITSNTNLNNAQLLDASVSVLQGILLGMGGE